MKIGKSLISKVFKVTLFSVCPMCIRLNSGFIELTSEVLRCH